MRYSREAKTGLFVARLFVLFLTQSTMLWGQGAALIGPGAASFPKLELPGISRGQKAITELGAHLPAVASAYGLDPEKLRSMLLKDLTLAIDRGGRLYATDP